MQRLGDELRKLPEAKPQIRGSVGQRQPMDRAALFLRKDKNNDGSLTREEFLEGQPDPAEAPKRFVKFDQDKNGTLTREEFISAGNSSR